MNHKELTMWILLELDAAGSIDYLVTQRRCGFARDDRLGVNRGRFFSFWAASFRHLGIIHPCSPTFSRYAFIKR